MRRTVSIILGTLVVVAFSHAAYGRGAICGDVDGDGRVTDTDATLVNRFAAGLETQLATTGCNSLGILQCGDVNQDGGVDLADWVSVQRAAQGLSSPCSVEGFAAGTNRVAGSPARSYISVTSIVDTIPATTNTLRWALGQASSMGGGLIVFDLTGANRTIVVAGPSGLTVPANTVVDGIGSNVTINGANVPNNGTVNVYNSNVAVRHVRVRNAGNDGIQVAPKGSTPAAISNIAIHRVSVTKSGDGGIDVNGCLTLNVSGCANGTTSNVTLAENFISANGSFTGTNNGGGNLTKYGVNNVTMVGNFWEKNYRRNPLVDNNAGTGVGFVPVSLADVHHSLVRSSYLNIAGWAEVFGTGAQTNMVDSCFEGSSSSPNIISLAAGGAVYVSGNSWPAGYTQVAGGTPSATPFGSAPCLSSTNRNTVFDRAGAAPRDAVDLCYINATDYTDARNNCP